MKKFFESKEVLTSIASIRAPDAKMIFTEALLIQYEQLLLDKNVRQYLKTIMISKKILRWKHKKHPYKKHTKSI